MTVNNSPVFMADVGSDFVATTGASTSADASTSTNIVKLISANGSRPIRVERVRAVHAPASATTAQSANVLRVYVKKGGTTFYLRGEIAVITAARSSSVPGNAAEFTGYDGLPLCILGATDELWVASHVAEQYHWAYDGGPM